MEVTPIISYISKAELSHLPEVEAYFNEQEAGEVNFVFRCIGDGMKPSGIYAGDYIFIRHNLTPENGKIVAALIDGEQWILRHYHFDPERQRMILYTVGDGVEPLVFEGEELSRVVIAGDAVFKQTLVLNTQ